MRGKGPGSKRSSAQIVPVVRKQAIGEKEARRNGKGVAQQQHPAPAPVSSGMARGSQQQISPTDSSTLLSRGLVLADLRQRLFGILIELPHRRWRRSASTRPRLSNVLESVGEICC